MIGRAIKCVCVTQRGGRERKNFQQNVSEFCRKGVDLHTRLPSVLAALRKEKRAKKEK